MRFVSAWLVRKRGILWWRTRTWTVGEADCRIHVLANPQIEKNLFIILSVICLSPGASLASRQREPFPKKSPREAWRRAWKDSLGGSREFSLPRLCKAGSLTSPLSPPVPYSTFPSTLLPHRTLWHDWVTHSFSIPHLRSLPGTTGDVWSIQLATPALSPVPQVLREGLEHLPETLARGRSLKADGRTLHYPLVHFLRDPTVCQLRDRTVCWGHSWAVEAAPGRDDPRSGLRSRAGRILPVALGSALRRATPPCGHCPGGSSCCSGNCLHPSPGSGYSPPPPASRARPGKPCLSLREYFPRAQN